MAIDKVGKKNTLDEREFRLLQEALVEAARQTLNLRSRVWAFSVLPEWAQEASFDNLVDMSAPAFGGKLGETPLDIIDTGVRVTKQLFYIRKGFRIHFKDLASSRQLGRDLDVGSARDIARQMAELENTTLANGNAFIEGLLNMTDRNSVTGGAWSGAGDPYEDIRKAINELQIDNYFGPYQVVVSPTRASDTRRIRGASVDTTHRDKIEDLLNQEGGGEFVIDASMPDTSAIVCDGRKAENFELLVGPDFRLMPPVVTGEWTEVHGLEAMLTLTKRGKSVCEITTLS